MGTCIAPRCARRGTAQRAPSNLRKKCTGPRVGYEGHLHFFQSKLAKNVERSGFTSRIAWYHQKINKSERRGYGYLWIGTIVAV